MDTLSYRTKHANDKTVKREWLIVDAEDQVLGRLATRIATSLMGKRKTYFTSHVDCGDYVIVINADKVKMTGKKLDDSKVITFTGYPGGQKVESPRELLNRKPIQVIENAVKDMLPHTKLGNAMFKKLFAYAGTKHPHTAQNPKPLK